MAIPSDAASVPKKNRDVPWNVIRVLDEARITFFYFPTFLQSQKIHYPEISGGWGEFI